ncbi:hypothetical protein EDC18_11163 [Natranaerovirga pectinivora]|uniref:Uncharacterized protein n=1 Tax=Natranaerovirga pectinivora TaxID=682400 RepID=A0A4V2UZW0_9FIRM|nr:hypothetical protein [Natranaerovirga pectinivora]TCT12892.1 hypothetical protein EDC18_11163 [Natranaerovirga pectinivora]
MKVKFNFLVLTLILSFVVLFYGCSSTNDNNDAIHAPIEETPIEGVDSDDDSDTNQDAQAQEIDLSQWPSEITKTIFIEGMEEEIFLNRFIHQDFLYLTYVPSDMISEYTSFNNGDSVRFYSNFNEMKNEDILVEFTFYDDDVSISDLENLLELYSWDLSSKKLSERLFSWSIAESYIQDESLIGTIALGIYSDQYFTLYYQHPWEFGDGFYPRLHTIIEEFYFFEDNIYLNELQ